ncbi:hypothetical protein N2152v2_010200 [Parachlorella kessleri]
MVAPTVEADSLWLALEAGDDLEPLASLLAPPDNSQRCCHGSLVGGEDLNLVLAAATSDTGQLTDGLAASSEDFLIGRWHCQPSINQASPPSNLSTILHPGPALGPAAGGHVLLAGPLSNACAGLASAAGLEIATLEGGGQALLGDTFFVPLQPAHDSAQQQQQQQQRCHPLKPQAGAISGPPKRRGRPPKDRSQLSEKQLQAISIAQAHVERKKNHMRDLEERMADVRVELERERAQQENNVQAIAALEQLLHYTEDMVTTLTQQGASSSLLNSSADAPIEPTVSRGSSSCFAATCYAVEQPLLTSSSARQQEPEQPDSPLEASSPLPGPNGYHAGQGVPPSLALELTPKCRQFAALERWQQILPSSISYQPMPDMLDTWGEVAAASPDVVAELKSAAPGDMVQGWRDAARRSRDAVAVYDVMKSEAWAVSRLGPMHQEGMGLLMKLTTIHNPACIRHLLMASADNLSEEQRREKYDAMVAAIDITPSQQERYLELGEAYTSFVQQARQHKAEALARLEQSAFSSMPASASAGRMVSRYLEALEGASVLSTYPDAELVAAVELMSGMGAITKPLQKVKAAAMAYPHFIDMMQVMEAIKRLPPPE